MSNPQRVVTLTGTSGYCYIGNNVACNSRATV